MKNVKEFRLDGLCCANCAAKIENEVNRLDEVEHASINLVNNKLSVALKDNLSTNIYDKVKKIVASHEDSVKVIELSNKIDSTSTDKKETHKEEEENGTLYMIRLATALLLGIIIPLFRLSDNIKLVLYLIAYLLAGYDVLWKSAKNIAKGNVFDENFLMGFASLGAFIIGDEFEAITVLVFYGIGELLQDMAVHKSRKNIEGLMDIRPDYANLVDGESFRVVSPEEVLPGDIIIVQPGEKIPLDGTVISGSSFIDTKALTGESVPREVISGDEVLSGSINANGLLKIRVTKPFGESTVSKIIELVQNSGNHKAESEKFITKFARYYTPTVVFIALAVAIIPPLLGFGSLSQWIYRGLSFLIISCPCALVISIPISFFGGIGGAARQGVLIKGGNYLDALSHLDTIVFDKTGTLTQGVFQVSGLYPADGIEEEDLLYYANVAESHSTHPIAKSIRTYYEANFSCNCEAQEERSVCSYCHDDKNMQEAKSIEIIEKAGYGIIAKSGEDIIYAGNKKLMDERRIQANEKSLHGSIVHIAVNDKYFGCISISDEIKPNAKETIERLKDLGIRKAVMLTGDHEANAKVVAEKCLLDAYSAELLPQDKVSKYREYSAKTDNKSKTAFVGDGINDAPVLAGADIGIAMGGIGSDAAIEAADIVIMNDDISKIATAVKVAKKTKVIVYQNIILALGFKVAIMILSFFGITSIWFAIFADVGVALLAIFNSMRAMFVK